MRLIRGFFHLCFAAVPGCGQMCQGYMKRGISQTIIFFVLVFIVVFLELGALMLLILPLWVYSFFDSFNLGNSLNNIYFRVYYIIKCIVFTDFCFNSSNRFFNLAFNFTISFITASFIS